MNTSEQKKQQVASEEITKSLKPTAQTSSSSAAVDANAESAMEDAEQLNQRMCSIVIIDLNCKEIHLRVRKQIVV